MQLLLLQGFASGGELPGEAHRLAEARVNTAHPSESLQVALDLQQRSDFRRQVVPDPEDAEPVSVHEFE